MLIFINDIIHFLLESGKFLVLCISSGFLRKSMINIQQPLSIMHQLFSPILQLWL